MQETKNLNIDNEKNFFYKTYEYKNTKALKIFLGFTREKGKNSFEIEKHLKNDFRLTYKTLDLWLNFEKKFFEKEYYHMDFSLGNFFIDKENGKIAFIDFDDIVRKPPFFRKRLYLTKSIRSFEGSMKFFLSVKNFSKEENQKIIDRLEEIKKQYGVVSRKKDLEMTKKILNR